MVFTPAALVAFLNGNPTDFLAAHTPGGIENQEAEGQRFLCENSLIPKDGYDEHAKNFFASEKIEIIENFDNLFHQAKLPSGWMIKPVEGTSFLSKLIDPAGKIRADIFYKAAFYDKRAQITFI